MIWLAAPVLIGGGAGGALLLRRAWADRARERPALVAAGWSVIAAAIALGAWWIGPVKGVALAIAALAIGALVIVARGRVRRVSRAERDASLAPEPLDGPSRAWRGWLKALLAGPLGMTAAMAVAFSAAVWLPGDPRTRLILAALAMPVLWAGAMTWTLADQRLLRATAVLAGTTVAGFALAALGSLA